MKKKKTKNKLISAVLIISVINLIFFSCVNISAQPVAPAALSWAEKHLAAATAIESTIDNAEAILFLTWVSSTIEQAMLAFNTHMREYVVTNPDTRSDSDLIRIIGFFISFTQIFYILSIVLTGFYLLFVSSSARARAKAKYVLGRLIIGMILVTISPFLLQLLFGFSSSLTEAVLDQANLLLVTNEYNGLLERSREVLMTLSYPMFAQFGTGLGVGSLEGVGTLSQFWNTPKAIWSSVLGGVKSGIGRSSGALTLYPYLFFDALLVFTLGLFALRYLMVTLWAILLPLSIFFTSFELTKNIGRVMMEQTFQWTFIQIVLALTLVALSIGLTILPDGYRGYSIFLISFHSIGCIAIMFWGPWYLTSLLQRLFPR